MTTTRSTIVACIDGSSHNKNVVDYAAWISLSLEAPLKLLHTIEHRTPAASDLSGSIGVDAREDLLQELTSLEARRSKILLEQGKIMLGNAKARATDSGVTDILKLQRHGNLEESLAELEDEIRVLVIGVRGEGHEHQYNTLGEHLETTIRSLHRPILVANNTFVRPPTRCMLAYDGSDAAKKALDMVSTSPLFTNMECHLVYVSKQTNNNLLDAPAEKLKSAGLTVMTANLQGDAKSELANYQQKHSIELTIMGAFGHSRIKELFFGSLTHEMLLRSTIPLLLLR